MFKRDTLSPISTLRKIEFAGVTFELDDVPHDLKVVTESVKLKCVIRTLD